MKQYEMVVLVGGCHKHQIHDSDFDLEELQGQAQPSCRLITICFLIGLWNFYALKIITKCILKIWCLLSLDMHFNLYSSSVKALPFSYVCSFSFPDTHLLTNNKVKTIVYYTRTNFGTYSNIAKHFSVMMVSLLSHFHYQVNIIGKIIFINKFEFMFPKSLTLKQTKLTIFFLKISEKRVNLKHNGKFTQST